MATELVGLDGRDADTEVAVNLQDVLHKLLEICALKFITPHVDASQYDFLESMGDDIAYIIIYILGGAACGTASDHGNDAVGAEVVAAVVDLDEAASVEGVEGGVVAEQVTVVALGVAVPRAEMLVDNVEQGGLALVVDDIVGDVRLQQLLFPVVDHAARDDDERLGVLASYLMDGLPTFLVADVGDSAGVHDKDIGVGIAVGDVVARRFET